MKDLFANTPEISYNTTLQKGLVLAKTRKYIIYLGTRGEYKYSFLELAPPFFLPSLVSWKISLKPRTKIGFESDIARGLVKKISEDQLKILQGRLEYSRLLAPAVELLTDRNILVYELKASCTI